MISIAEICEDLSGPKFHFGSTIGHPAVSTSDCLHWANSTVDRDILRLLQVDQFWEVNCVDKCSCILVSNVAVNSDGDLHKKQVCQSYVKVEVDSNSVELIWSKIRVVHVDGTRR